MTMLIEVKDVVLRLGGRTILDHVSLTVAPGEIVALVGPNGAGKSTLLRVMSGDLGPQAGEVTLKGQPLASYVPRVLAQHRAVLSQHTHVAFPFTVAEIVRMGAAGSRPVRWVDEAARRMMQHCDVTHLADQAVTRLSGGEQQRVHLARTLLQLEAAGDDFKPSLLLLDEPTASLDLGHQLRVLDLAREQAVAGIGVVMVIHDLNLAAMLATKVVMMKRGRIVSTGPVSEVICNKTVEAVFDVRDSTGIVPSGNVPFVLPQSMRPV
jgi:iron complex transport system ATP-binding protein